MMSASGGIVIREASDHDLADFSDAARKSLRDAEYAATVSVNDHVAALAVVHRRGTPAHPDEAALELHSTGDGAFGGVDERAAVALLEAAVGAARAAGHPRVVIQWDAMDAPGIRRIEQAGFKPKIPPYFELGEGQLEYVMGYRDPAGSTLELVRELSQSP